MKRILFFLLACSAALADGPNLTGITYGNGMFVAVGAAHLAGPDSVLKLLEKDGWKAERE